MVGGRRRWQRGQEGGGLTRALGWSCRVTHKGSDGKEAAHLLRVDGAMLFDSFENDLGEEGGFVELSGATPLALEVSARFPLCVSSLPPPT